LGEVTVTTTDAAKSGTGNWGRWGEDDQRGALNLITPELVLEALRIPKSGKVYSLALPIGAGGPIIEYRGAPKRLTLTSSSDGAMYEAYGAAPGVGTNEDVLILAAHSLTHMDALAHVFSEGTIYNGYAASGFTSNAGAARCDITNTGSFAGRAVLLDLPGHQGVDWLEPGHVIDGGELEACRAAQGVEIRAGDILLIRTGWLDFFATGQGDYAQPGVGFDAATYIADHDVAAVGSDNAAIESIPFDDNVFLGVHIELLQKHGITLLEHLVLKEMADDRCYESLLCVGALPFTGAAGSPINPIAIG
jgi:kynurenine formamidase